MHFFFVLGAGRPTEKGLPHRPTTNFTSCPALFPPSFADVPAHAKCLKFTAKLAAVVRDRKDWVCPECKFCSICFAEDAHDKLARCGLPFPTHCDLNLPQLR